MAQRFWRVSCGPLSLELAGIPSISPDSLIQSLVHQIHLQSPEILTQISPSDIIQQITQNICQFIQQQPNHNGTIGGDLQGISDCFQIKLIIFHKDDRYEFNPTYGFPSARVQLYHYQQFFDSVVSIFPRAVINDPVPKSNYAFIRMSSWNVRGATDQVKRALIDEELKLQKVWVVGVQESHLWAQSLNTPTYKWILGSQKQQQARASRGLGFLIHRDFNAHILETSFVTSNIGFLSFQLPYMNKPFYFINVHKCNNGDPNSGIETGILSRLIREKLIKGHVIIAGDFNAHFGCDDEQILSSDLFGKILLHKESNINGDEIYMLCSLLNLEVPTTIQHRSTKITWTNGSNSSQIDHILFPTSSQYSLQKLQGTWSKINTDHKRLSWYVCIPINGSPKEFFKFPESSVYYSKLWDFSGFTILSIREKYEELMSTCIKNEQEKDISWGKISSIACFSAEKVFKKRKHAMTIEQQSAYDEYKHILKLFMKQRVVDKNPSKIDLNLDYPPIPSLGLMAMLRSSYKKLQRVKNNNKSHQALENFLKHLNEKVAVAAQRIQMAFDYLKVSRRSATQLCSNSITVKHWSDDLVKFHGPNIELLPENDFFPLLPPPTFNDMVNVIKNMKNNKTPGTDNVCVEMLKSSETLCYQLYRLIRRAYLNNEIPSEWQQTYTVPIPKVRNPKSINDFRKLTMCNNANKIYSVLLMEQLRRFLPDMEYYQSGFIKNRSCDDLCFVMRNVLDYRWNRGEVTYVFSLDLRKAFDMVKISILPDILINYGAPNYLINRIIKSVLTERNKILWKGQFTPEISKSTGIKQGCKISPELFIYILHEAVKATKEELKQKGIILCTGSKGENLILPILQAYADDSYVLCDNIADGLQICEIFQKHLAYYGLEFNLEKCGVLIKGASAPMPASIPFMQSTIPVVSSLRVLGTTINSSMKRKASIKPRLNTALKMFKCIFPYLKNLKAPMSLLVKLYETIIVPSMIYGLNCSSMTKGNQQTLMRREIYFIKELSNIAQPRPAQSTIADILSNRTINRKVTVNRLRLYYHIKRSDPESLTLKSLNYNEDVKRRIGRPIFDFKETLKRDFRKYLQIGITRSDMDQDYELRDTIKRLTSELYNEKSLNDDPLSTDVKLYCENELSNQ